MKIFNGSKFWTAFFGLIIMLSVGVIGVSFYEAVAPSPARATALSADRNTPMRDGILVSYKMGTTDIYKGSLVCITDSTGYARPCADTAGLIVAGVADTYVDGGSTAGTYRVNVWQQKAFKFTNSTDHAIDQDDVGAVAYVDDDEMVGTTGTNTIPVGIIQGYDSGGVWVYIPSPSWQTSLASVYSVGHVSLMIGGTVGGDTVYQALTAYKAGTILAGYLTCDLEVSDTATANLTMDVLIGTTTVFSTKPSIAKAATCSAAAPCNTYTAATGVVPGVVSTSADDFTAGQIISLKADVTNGTTVTNYSTNCNFEAWFKALVQ